MTSPADSSGGLRASWISPRIQLIHNTGFAHGSNDGAVWAGRGLTTVLEGGFSAAVGAVSLVVSPVAFFAQNAGFDLADNGQTGRLQYADAAFPLIIDNPQRFGGSSYARIDPGQSTLRIDVYGVTGGLSTANQHWGPAREFPLLLGNNAPGFPHAFIGTSAPADVAIGWIHGRLIAGRLSQSEYAVPEGAEETRLMTGLVMGFSPSFIPGLEVGVGRFIHEVWPESGLSLGDLTRPIGSIYASGAGNSGGNQLASAFARWVFPSSRLELYGEYLRDDWTWGLRDLLLFPDQNAGYLIGFQKSWTRTSDDWLVVRGEIAKARTSPSSPLGYTEPLYVHHMAFQGHTERGQILGSPAVFRGAGSILAADLFHRGGRWTLEWTRSVRQDLLQPSGGVTFGSDAIHSLGTEALFFRNRLEVAGRADVVYEFDRYLRSDAFNLRTSASLRYRM